MLECKICHQKYRKDRNGPNSCAIDNNNSSLNYDFNYEIQKSLSKNTYHIPN